MISCIRKFSIDCGHRVYGHESKCAHLHGHTYGIEVHARALTQNGNSGLDSLGRVIDFSVLKERIGTWLDREWDHGFLVYVEDMMLLQALSALATKKYIFPFNPTAENIARYLLEKTEWLLADTGVEVFKVVVHETPNCFAEASR